MPTVTYQFATFGESGSGVSWTGQGDADANDGSYAQANFSGILASSKLLLCTNLQSVSLPANAVVTAVRVRIEAKHTSGGGNAAQIHEVYGWDNTAGIVKGKNLAASPNTITLTTTDTYYPLGGDRAGWLFWNIERLNDSAMGVAIRCQRTGGMPTVQIDHVELQVDYERLWNGFPVLDPRLIVYDRVAGQSGTGDLNEVSEPYQPSTSRGAGMGSIPWHTDADGYLNDVIAIRTGRGRNRLILGTPAGQIDGQFYASAQWEPMFDEQRAALISVMSDWLKGDPERQAILYLGTKIGEADSLRMQDEMGEPAIRVPDVTNATDLDVLKRIYFPYRDLVGIKVFGLDAAGVPWEDNEGTDRAKLQALFQWGRENGMEFMLEAPPRLNGGYDDTIINDQGHGGYASTNFISREGGGGNDQDFEWRFSKDRITAEFELDRYWEGADTSRKKMAVYKMFARAGYAIVNKAKQPDQILSDFEAGQVAAQYYVRKGGSHPATGSAAFCAGNSINHLWDHAGANVVGTGIM